MIIVTLVHGTFAHGTSWVKSSSPLSRHLCSDPAKAVEIREFGWSGRNSHKARMDAASRLRRELEQLLDERPDDDHCVVGHSHGGTVALYAIKPSPALRGRVRVVCLSTPFIFITRRDLPFPLSNAFLGSIALLSGLLLCLLLVRFHSVPGVSFLIVIWMAFVAWLARVEGMLGERAEKVAAEASLDAIENAQLLLVRLTSDEASMALSSFQFLNWLAASLASLPGRYFIFKDSRMPIAVMVSGAASVIGLIVSAVIGKTWPVVIAGIPMVFGLLVPGVIMFGTEAVGIPLLLILALLTIPAASDLGWLFPFLALSVESTPPGCWTVHLFEAEPFQKTYSEGFSVSLKPIVHSRAYEDPRVLSLVKRWLLGLETSG